jgi:Uma2 family endonuclease
MRTATLLRAEEFFKVAQVLGPCDLVRGEVVAMSPGGFRHGKVSTRVCRLLAEHCDRQGLGHVVTNETGIVVARRPDTVRGADVAFISFDRLPRGSEPVGFLEQPPELVVEVLGDDVSWKAMEEKIAEYHGFGVDLAWVLDPRTLSLRAYPRGAAPSLHRDAETVTASPHVPGFTVRVGDLFA